MRILVVCRSFPHHRPGGLEWHAHDVLQGLIAAGHQVSIITTPLPVKPALIPLTTNGKIFELGRQPGRYDLAFFLQLTRRLRAICREVQPDIIHTQGFAGIIVHQVAHIPSVTTLHGSLWSETPLAGGMSPRGALRHFRRYKHRFLFLPLWLRYLRSRPPIIVDSLFSRDVIRREARRPRLRASIVPLGIDLARMPELHRIDARRQLGHAPSDILIVSIGRIERIKGIDMLIDAFEAMAPREPRARLIIAGDGSALAAIRQRARRSPSAPRIHVTGPVAPPRVHALLAAADLFVNPDRGLPAFGLSNAEALCYGTPVLTTPNGAHPEVVHVESGDGWLATADVDSWSKALASVCRELPESDDQRIRRCERARERFTRDRMINHLLSAYGRVLRGKR